MKNKNYEMKKELNAINAVKGLSTLHISILISK